jgi:hypothetical protein
MRPRVILIISAGLNAGLIVALLMVAVRRHTHTLAPDGADASTATSSVAPFRVVVRKQFFSWDEVEAADYPTYLRNLREIRCPEQTIRDIIIADVNQLYARKRLTEVITADQQWWRSDPDETVQEAANAKAQALDQERRQLLTTLLGPDWETSNNPGPPRPGIILNGPVLGALAPDVKQAVIDISTRSQQRVATYFAAQVAAGKNPDLSEVARIRLDARNELTKILNPVQLEEFLLRYSQTASALRREFRGFDVTPDEFRQAFRNVDAIDQQLALNSGGDTPTAAQQRDALQKRHEEAIKNTLGPDRYEDYRMVEDPAYRDAVLAAGEVDAPPDVVTNLYALNLATSQEFDRIRNDPNLSPEDKAAQLKAAEDQLKAARDQLLGLTPLPPPPPTPPPLPTHAYVPGETIDVIANNYGVSPDALRAVNPNVDFTQLSKGVQIKIPSPPGASQ